MSTCEDSISKHPVQFTTAIILERAVAQSGQRSSQFVHDRFSGALPTSPHQRFLIWTCEEFGRTLEHQRLAPTDRAPI